MPVLPQRLQKHRTCLMVVDVQERFRPLIHDMALVLANASRLVRFCDRLEIPLLFTEHYPDKLGATVRELAELPRKFEPLEKISFSCTGDARITAQLRSLRRDQVILCGIETHVCVYQTARDLLEDGYQVVVAADAVSSRQASNRNLALAYMRDLGVQVMTTEMILFEILKVARTDDFRAVADILKEDPRPGGRAQAENRTAPREHSARG